MKKLKFVGKPDSNGNISCHCPFHNDKHPSASYNIKTGLFYCFACGEAANKEKLENEFGEIDFELQFGEAFENNYVPDKFDWWSYYQSASESVNEYAYKRLVTQSTANLFQMRFTDDAVLFPITNNLGDIVGIQVRQIYEAPKYMIYLDIERKPILTPSHLFDDRKFFWLTEGFFGMLRMRQAGFNTYTTLGSRISKRHINMLKYYAGFYAAIFDDDVAGRKGMLRLGYGAGALVHIPGVAIDDIPLEHVAVHALNVGTPEQLIDYIMEG